MKRCTTMTSLLEKKVQHLINETSEKYAADPSRDQILSDLLIGTRRISNSVRWKEFWMLEKQRKKKIESESTTSSVANHTRGDDDSEGVLTTDSSKALSFAPEDESDDDEIKFKEDGGLHANLKPLHRIKRAPMGTCDLESFLKTLETELIDDLCDKYKIKTYVQNDRSKAILERTLHRHCCAG